MKWTIANVVTFFRLFLIIVFVALLFFGYIHWALLVLGVAWGLDFVDGWLARRLKQETRFGDVLDKTTDRIMVIIAVLSFIKIGLIPDYSILLLTKDIAAIPALTIYSAANKQMASIGWHGKFLMFLQGISFLWLYLSLPFSVFIVAIVAVYGGLVGCQYLYQAAYK